MEDLLHQSVWFGHGQVVWTLAELHSRILTGRGAGLEYHTASFFRPHLKVDGSVMWRGSVVYGIIGTDGNRVHCIFWVLEVLLSLVTDTVLQQ